MLIAGFPAGSFQANCYVLAVGRGNECLVVDPGENAVDPLREVLRTHDLTPAAVLLTHGHLDHIASAAEICRWAQIPAYVHAGDEHLLDDPLSGLNDMFRQMLQGIPLDDLRPPDVRTLGTELHTAGLHLAVDHTPGHTPGSVVFRFQAVGDGQRAGDSGGERPEVLLTGDTLFAGSVGRTDLPGGSWEVLVQSLRTKLLSRPDDAVILPGHGPGSTIGAERIGNPFLAP